MLTLSQLFNAEYEYEAELDNKRIMKNEPLKIKHDNLIIISIYF